jgi:hypothetical protein
MTPLMAIASVAQAATPTSINHQNGELATTVSFNLADGVSLSDAQAAIKQAEADIAMPTNVRGSFQGSARSANDQNKQQPFLVAAAIVAIYIVLGILYESYVHPLTVLSTLPAAGVGAMLALLVFKMEFSVIALIGVFLLLGIVKKNAILIIDFALEAQRARADRDRGGARGQPAALPPDPDDHPGRRPGRLAAGHRLRGGGRTAPAAGDHHHRRPDRQPAADPDHHPGRLRLSRPPAGQGARRALPGPHALRAGARLMSAFKPSPSPAPR